MIIGFLALAGCGGSLSEEQRKRLHEGMQNQEIQQITDAEIVTASLEYGRSVFRALESTKFDTLKKDSIGAKYKVRLRWIVPGSSSSMEVEDQLIQAYVIGAETGATQDNIQKLRANAQATEYDSLLYSRPIVTPLPDGSVNVEGVWNIYVSRKEIIRTYKKK